MIVLDLQCGQGHRFEGWFASSAAFDDQRKNGLLCCPVCNHADVERLPCGPYVISSSTARAAEAGESLAAVRDQLLEAVTAYVRDSENVGPRFPEEARKIHYQEAPARSIRGVASLREARELLDEGIVVLPLPVPPPEETH